MTRSQRSRDRDQLRNNSMLPGLNLLTFISDLVVKFLDNYISRPSAKLNEKVLWGIVVTILLLCKHYVLILFYLYLFSPYKDVLLCATQMLLGGFISKKPENIMTRTGIKTREHHDANGYKNPRTSWLRTVVLSL